MNPNYQNFRTAIYCTVRDLKRLQDLSWAEQSFKQLQRSIKIDKVYLESFRSMELASKEELLNAKTFFEKQGIACAGGITTSQMTTPEWDFKSLCYNDPEQRSLLETVSRRTAEVFDEFILDDFFFTNCTCERCVENKGDKTWPEYRLELMAEVANNLIVKPAKKQNPNVNVVVKYPNWYQHFASVGYNLNVSETGFDALYTGTETRDARYTSQHLPPYQSYGILRYFNRVSDLENGGGWVDPFIRRDLDRYAEQIRLTLLAKAKEITLFCYGVLVDWNTEFDDSPTPANWVAPVAGNILEDTDSIVGQLGEPFGLDSYCPIHASGEDFIHHYLGTAGIPIEMHSTYPEKANTLLLSESAGADPDIASRIEESLMSGKRVIITSGLLKKLDKSDVLMHAGLACSDRRIQVNSFYNFTELSHSDEPILIPQVLYATNAATEVITCLKNENGYPLLLRVLYGNGELFVLTVPDTFSDFYLFPREVLTTIKKVLLHELPLRVESEGKVGLFLYDNNTFIVHPFLPHNSKAEVVFPKEGAELVDLRTNKAISGTQGEGESRFGITLYPNTYRAFRFVC